MNSIADQFQILYGHWAGGLILNCGWRAQLWNVMNWEWCRHVISCDHLVHSGLQCLLSPHKILSAPKVKNPMASDQEIEEITPCENTCLLFYYLWNVVACSILLLAQHIVIFIFRKNCFRSSSSLLQLTKKGSLQYVRISLCRNRTSYSSWWPWSLNKIRTKNENCLESTIHWKFWRVGISLMELHLEAPKSKLYSSAYWLSHSNGSQLHLPVNYFKLRHNSHSFL